MLTKIFTRPEADLDTYNENPDNTDSNELTHDNNDNDNSEINEINAVVSTDQDGNQFVMDLTTPPSTTTVETTTIPTSKIFYRFFY